MVLDFRNPFFLNIFEGWRITYGETEEEDVSAIVIVVMKSQPVVVFPACSFPGVKSVDFFCNFYLRSVVPAWLGDPEEIGGGKSIY